MKCVVNKFKRFKERDDGNATVEFVILFPGLMMLFFAGFEAGYYMVRNVALERAVDIAVRDIRLGNGSQYGAVPDHAALKKRICDAAGIIPDCMQSVKVEIKPVTKAPGGVAAALGSRVQCIDKTTPPSSPQNAACTYDVGVANDLMLIHACATSDPLFPSTGLGVGMKVDAYGNVAIVATSAFVNEPGARSMMPSGSTGGSGGAGGSGGGSINSGSGSTNSGRN